LAGTLGRGAWTLSNPFGNGDSSDLVTASHAPLEGALGSRATAGAVVSTLGNVDSRGTDLPRDLRGLTGGDTFWLDAADVNRGGKFELVRAIAASNSVSMLLGNGDDTFGATRKVGPTSHHLVVGDFNGDAFVDLAQIDESGTSIDVLLNNANWHKHK
jgi:hypothetical protein